MRYIQAIIILCLMVFTFASKAQDSRQLKGVKLWLSNSNGKKVTQQDSIVGRDYFAAKGIVVHSEIALDQNTKYYVIVQQPNIAAYAELLNSPRFSERLILEISQAESCTKISIIVEEQKTKAGKKRGGVISFVLE